MKTKSSLLKIKKKFQKGSGTMIFGVMIMILLSTICIVQAQTFLMEQDYDDAQTTADTIADTIAIYAYTNGADYDEAVEYIEELAEVIEENTGVECSDITLDEEDYEEGTANVSVTVSGTYSGVNGVSEYNATATAATAFSIIPGEGVAAAVQYAIEICDEPGVTYSQNARTGPNSYDCSGFVWRVLIDTGLLPEGTGVFWTGSMIPVLLRNGFVEVTNSVNMSTGDGLLAGDIVWKSGHTEIYIGDGQTAGAHSSRYSVDRQVAVVSYSSSFTRAFRYVGN